MINNNTKRIIFILTIISIYNTMTKVKRNDNIEYIFIYVYYVDCKSITIYTAFKRISS